jgi:hypothetical protein
VDVALDASGNIYTILPTEDPADPANRVFRFPPFDPATNKTALTTAQWAVGSKDDTMVGARGIAVDPTSTYVAVAFEDPLGSNGCTQIFFATNGSLVTNLDLGMVISGMSTHQDEDCAWDAVGNVYYIDNLFSVWRAVSPPGTNRATTVGLPTIQITRGSGGGPSVPPKITGLTVSNGVVALSFSGGTNDVPSDFSIQAAGSVTGPYVAITATIVAVGPGQFRATFPVGTGVEYYRVAGQGSTPPPSQLSFSHVKLSGNNLLLTFTAATNETAAAFTVLSAQTANGAFSPVSNPAISQISPGVFRATVAVSGPARFYRIKQ